MEGHVRLIWEELFAPGQNPTVQVDTDERSPPSFLNLVATPAQFKVILPGDADIAVTIPASCGVLLVSDEEVFLRLAAGETPMHVRIFAAAGDDSAGEAMPARTWLLSGNAASTAHVAIYTLATVT